ncbi:hypothetical protein ACQEU6_23000 [Spirillospora sp. CA-108201]
MCGLFGVVRSPFAADPGRASDVLVVLGALAEERGSDSAGLALLGAPPGLGGAGGGGCRVVRGRGRFSGVWRPEFLSELDRAAVAVGHTRRAARGASVEAGDAGPLIVPGAPAAVVGANDADIDVADLRRRYAPPAGDAAAGACGEPVLRLMAGRRSPSEITGVLQALVGRVALAWVERDRPTEVHLARGALSPLTVAVDTDQNIYWASNPRWFRDAERHTRVRFATVVLLREGTYLKVGMERRPGRRDLPEVLTTAAFAPTARDTDRDPRVWTGFTPADAEVDRAGLLHRVVQRTGGADGLLTVA